MTKGILFLILAFFLHSLFIIGYQNFPLLRVGQFISILLVFNYCLLERDKIDYLKGAKVLILTSLVVLLIDILLGRYHSSSKAVFGFNILRRYIGISGEANYSALTLMVSSLICFKYKRTFYVVLSFAILFFLGSRATLISLLVFYSLWFLSKFIHIYATKLLVALVAFCVIVLPLGIGASYNSLDQKNKDALNIVTSERSRLYSAYSNVYSLKPILGFGYTIAHKEYSKNPEKFGFHKKLEQHSYYLQLLTDFGTFGISIFTIFIFNLVFKLDVEKLVYLAPVLINLGLINGLSEIIIYIYLTFLLKDTDLMKETFSFKRVV